MAAIKHIRSAESYAHEAVSNLNKAILAAVDEKQDLLAFILRMELEGAIAMRDRLNGIKRAQEQAEAADPRCNPKAQADPVTTSDALTGHWYYECDGPDHDRTHYVWRYVGSKIERKDFPSKAAAFKFLDDSADHMSLVLVPTT